ncbi:MAG: 50S ribosomal protein L29 [Elusimicrobiota bacterium]
MKAKDRDAVKNLSAAELESQLLKTKEKFFKLSFKHRTTPLDNPVEMRTLRRHIARLKTWIEEKREVAA